MAAVLCKISDETLDLTARGLTMGVVNVTPDSFADAGTFLNADRAVELGVRMSVDGAAIVDVCGE